MSNNVAESNIEDQIHTLHMVLSDLESQLNLLNDKLTEVMCPTEDPLMNTVETPVMSRIAEHIFTASDRVCRQTLLVRQMNESLNITGTLQGDTTK